MNALNSFAAGVLIGGFVVSWALNEYTKKRKPPKIEINVDAELAKQINQKMVEAWLEQRGLVWMPKGMEYMAKKEKR